MYMKKYLMSLLVVAVLAGCSSAQNSAQGSIPPGMKAIDADAPKGALYEGSLANKQLMSDVLFPAYSFASSSNCDKAVDVKPYLSQEPKGSKQEFSWQEIWQFKCQNGNKVPVNITFTSVEGKGTYYVIK